MIQINHIIFEIQNDKIFNSCDKKINTVIASLNSNDAYVQCGQWASIDTFYNNLLHELNYKTTIYYYSGEKELLNILLC